MILTDNDNKTIGLIFADLRKKKKLSDEDKLFERFYDEYEKLNDSLSRDGQRFIRAYIKDFRYQQKREKERLKQQNVLSKEQKAKRKFEANRRLFDGMCVVKAQDSYDLPYLFELLFATLGVMSESDQKKLNIGLAKHGYAIKEDINKTDSIIYQLSFVKSVDNKTVYLSPFDLESTWLNYRHVIRTFEKIDEHGKEKYKYETVKSGNIPLNSNLIGNMVKESSERYHRKKTIQKNIEKTKQNLILETP